MVNARTQKTPEKPGFRVRTVDDTGLEHTTNSSGKTPFSESGGAESGAVGAENGPIDADLRSVINAWPDLPEAVKAAVSRLVETADTVAK